MWHLSFIGSPSAKLKPAASMATTAAAKIVSYLMPLPHSHSVNYGLFGATGLSTKALAGADTSAQQSFQISISRPQILGPPESMRLPGSSCAEPELPSDLYAANRETNRLGRLC